MPADLNVFPESPCGVLVGRGVDPGPPGVATESQPWRLVPDAVVLNSTARDKSQLFHLAATELQRVYCVDPAVVLRALWRRELAGSTALGEGIALPHARVARIDRPVAALIRTANPIAFDAPDDAPVSLVLVLIVPADGDPDEHLHLLAQATTLLSESHVRERLRNAPDVRTVLRIFAEAPDRTSIEGRDGRR